jgi:16S rRNA (adenine1518-N6/adenine1519-N6)-dimethyltransferase
MEINRKNVMEVIEKSGLKPDKDYGQNYLLEPELAKRIIDLLEIKSGENVLEIGPGLGSLSHFLSLYSESKITLVDIDERMINFLKIIYNASNISLVLNDIRKHEVTKYDKIVGNLPYNITTETVVYLLENAKNAKKMVLMCQAEAFPRFNDLSGKEYGPVSILVHLLGNSKRNFTVKPGSFYPIPKCSSVVFTIDLNNDDKREQSLEVYRFAKKMFLNRRKTIYNNLSSFLGNKETASELLKQSNIDPSKRPEELSPSNFVTLYECVNKNSKLFS